MPLWLCTNVAQDQNAYTQNADMNTLCWLCNTHSSVHTYTASLFFLMDAILSWLATQLELMHIHIQQCPSRLPPLWWMLRSVKCTGLKSWPEVKLDYRCCWDISRKHPLPCTGCFSCVWFDVVTNIAWSLLKHHHYDLAKSCMKIMFYYRTRAFIIQEKCCDANDCSQKN